MPTNNRGNRGNRGRNNNPEGRNQYSGGMMDMARDRPFAAAATAAAAVGAGVFLWSKRNQISEQISNLSDQISEWSQNFGSSGQGEEFGSFDDTAGLTTTGGTPTGGSTGTRGRSGTGRSTGRTGMSETGGGNASLGAHSGGGGTTASASGRSRANQSPTS